MGRAALMWEEPIVLRLLVPVVLILAAGCGPTDRPPRGRLERLYADLVTAAAPAPGTEEAPLPAVQALIDSLGGAARAESLLAESMASEPARWRVFLDSLAKSLP